MTRKVFGLITWLMSAALSGWVVGHPPAYAGSPEQGHSADLTPSKSDEATALEAKLSDWPACVSLGLASTRESYPDPASWINASTFGVLQDLLRAGISNNTRALCVIDAALVRSQDGNTSSLDRHYRFNIAALMEMLADNWKEQGVLERADQLYGRAYVLFQNTWEYNWATVWVLQDWALLKLDLGQPERAKELASLQTELARQAYLADQSASSSRKRLVEALTVQASILEKLGLGSEAQAARDEAQALRQK